MHALASYIWQNVLLQLPPEIINIGKTQKFDSYGLERKTMVSKLLFFARASILHPRDG